MIRRSKIPRWSMESTTVAGSHLRASPFISAATLSNCRAPAKRNKVRCWRVLRVEGCSGRTPRPMRHRSTTRRWWTITARAPDAPILRMTYPAALLRAVLATRLCNTQDSFACRFIPTRFVIIPVTLRGQSFLWLVVANAKAQIVQSVPARQPRSKRGSSRQVPAAWLN
jgi:hypothetical protein